MKRWWLHLIIFCLLLAAVLVLASGYKDFVIDRNGIVTKWTGKGPDVRIPAYVKGIAPGVFASDDPDAPVCLLEKISFSKGFEEIPDKAFYGCAKLKTVELPEGLKKIGENAFQDCVSLETIVIPDSVTKVGSGAFQGCTALGGVTFSAGVSEISDHLFYGCTSLKYFDIPEGVESIGASAFESSGIGDIHFPISVGAIGDLAFHNCPALLRVVLRRTGYQISDTAFDHTTRFSLPVWYPVVIWAHDHGYSYTVYEWSW